MITNKQYHLIIKVKRIILHSTVHTPYLASLFNTNSIVKIFELGIRAT